MQVKRRDFTASVTKTVVWLPSQAPNKQKVYQGAGQVIHLSLSPSPLPLSIFQSLSLPLSSLSLSLYLFVTLSLTITCHCSVVCVLIGEKAISL